MIKFDKSKCNCCESCIKICHTKCMFLEGDEVAIRHDLCSTCGQCVAICSTGALTWKDISNRKIDRNLLPSADSLLELLKARHSIRNFKREKIDDEILEQICHVASIAPTNVYDLALIVVRDDQTIQQLEEVALGFIKKVNFWLYSNPILFPIMKRFSSGVNEMDKVKTKNTLKRHSIFQGATTLILVLADAHIAHSEASVQYAMYNMSLRAQTLGIGTFISGAGKIILSRNKKVKKEILPIPKDKSIMGVLCIGYPEVRFTRTIEGKLPDIYWC